MYVGQRTWNKNKTINVAVIVRLVRKYRHDSFGEKLSQIEEIMKHLLHIMIVIARLRNRKQYPISLFFYCNCMRLY